MASRPRSGIYKIINTVNGRYYVGSTKDKKKRWAYHRWCLRREKHQNAHLQRAWNLYGEVAFRFVWVCDVPENMLLVEEQKFLDENPDGYNMAKCAEAFAKGIRWSAERKRKASIACTGRKHSEETKKKIGDIQRGKAKGPRSAEHCRKLSESMKGKQNGLGSKRSADAIEKSRLTNLGNKHWLGKTHTDETKRKIGDANRGHVMSDEQRKLISENQTGRKQSDATKAKRAASLRAYRQRKKGQQAPVSA